uniref:TPR repeat-containing thioredoxin TTL1 n=1 Tax=Erigeron canadensis TaxID=72917 RepID=UPI001CB89250|nr:TPR repeat-containing thioredoxin TTL1 [Erigeron canadensis]
MSHSPKPIPKTSPTDNTSKPDFRELHLGSPVSPLQPVPSPSTSSSSSGSVPGQHEKRVHFHSSPRKSHSRKSHSRELSVDSPPTSSTGNSPVPKSGQQARSYLKTGMMTNQITKPEVLSLGSCNYGHGSIIRSGSFNKSSGPETESPVSVVSKSPGSETESPVSGVSKPLSSRKLVVEGDELKKLGNEEFKKGNYALALRFYDRAISVSPKNAAYHTSRATALSCLNRLSEAVKEYEESIRLDCEYMRPHRRLGYLLISLGQVENARRHLFFPGSQPDQNELKKLQSVEKHINKCAECRGVRDWAGVLRECDAAIVSGADASPQLFACKAEAFLKLHRLDEADLSVTNVVYMESFCSFSCSQTNLFGMALEAYILFVRAQIDMAFGRFENAVISIEKSGQIDPQNIEVATLLQNIRSVCKARDRGNDNFKSERFTEACSTYGEGLRLDPSNPVLYCNRAACWFKLGKLERSLDDCNQALLIHPTYKKALLRRAATYSKLERWAESIRDYEVLRKEIPDNNEIAESLFHAQVALKKSRGEEVCNMKFGGEAELITSHTQFKSAIASAGVSVAVFRSSSDARCKQMSHFLDTLCTRYPSILFLKVDIEASPFCAKAENVSIVPTIKIYKKGHHIKGPVCPTQEALESLVKYYNS